MRTGIMEDEKGYVLVTTMFILVALTMIGLAGIFISSLDTSISGNERTLTQCWDLSDAGTREALARIISNTLPAGVPGSPPPPISATMGGGTYQTGHYDSSIGIGPVSLSAQSAFYGQINTTWTSAYAGFGYIYYIVPVTASMGGTACKEIEVAVRLFK